MTGRLNWFAGGIALGLVFFLAVLLVKPVGVSTQFVILDGVIWSFLSDEIVVADSQSKSGYTSSNVYLAKSDGKYAADIANPLNYGFVFVVSIILGAFLSSVTRGPVPTSSDRIAPEIWRSRFGGSASRRYVLVFLGGVLVLFGARLAGGCTSGHMMSGMMQTSVSGYVFAAAAFLTAIPLAVYLYRKT